MLSQNGCRYADIIFKLFFLYENWYILIMQVLVQIGSDGLARNRHQATPEPMVA